MMSEQKRNRGKIVIAAVCLAAAAAALLLVWRLASPEGAAGRKEITVEVVHGDGSSRSFELTTEEAYLGPAMVSGGVVEDNQGPYGLYILTADGETADKPRRELQPGRASGTAQGWGTESQASAEIGIFLN